MTARPNMIRGFGRGMAAMLLAFVIVAPLPLTTSAAHASFPGVNGRIAFDDPATGQIYAVNPDGTGLLQLTHTRAFAGHPAWSPDGTQIAFEKEYKGRIVLWLMQADGSDKHRVTDERRGRSDFVPAFTPDATHLVYSRCRQFRDEFGGRVGTCRILSVATDGTDRTRLTSTDPPLEVFDFDPAVSPDGSTIVFTRYNQNITGIKAQIWEMDADGTNQHPISAPYLEAIAPDWSPDGTRIAFTSDCCRPGSDGYVMDADGTDPVRLTSSPFPHNDMQLTFSPDGQRMVFWSDRNIDPRQGGNVDMFVMNADGTGQQTVDLPLSGPRDFSWGTAPLSTATSPATSPPSARSSARVPSDCRFIPQPVATRSRCA